MIKNMEVICRCGDNCIKSKSEVLKNLKDYYAPCDSCIEFKLKKFSPLRQQININALNADFGKCSTCGKRHLDVVMAHILKIMIEEGIKDRDSLLRNVCSPLITPAFPLDSAPYLPENSLVILANDINTECAQRIVNEIPEVKGVLKGNLSDTVGVKDSETNPTTYELMGGCDLRCDIVNTPWGPLSMYKYQGQIHIELPKPLSPKIKLLKKVLSKYNDLSVLDCTCGPGTLGIASLLSGARFVVFNDLWFPACQTTMMNLEMNGFSISNQRDVSNQKENKGLIATGDKFEVYCLDIKELDQGLDEKFDVCLVDVFPGVETRDFTESVQNICKEIIII